MNSVDARCPGRARWRSRQGRRPTRPTTGPAPRRDSQPAASADAVADLGRLLDRAGGPRARPGGRAGRAARPRRGAASGEPDRTGLHRRGGRRGSPRARSRSSCCRAIPSVACARTTSSPVRSSAAWADGRAAGPIARSRLPWPTSSSRSSAGSTTRGCGSSDGRVEPLAVSGASILSSTTRADGFVIVPADLEGYPAGAAVAVWLYDETSDAAVSSRMPREQEQFLDVVDRDTAERRWWDWLRPRVLRGRSVSRWPRRSGGCWPPTSSPRSTCRPSTARTSTASRCGPRTPSAPPRRSPRRLAAQRRGDRHGRRPGAVGRAGHGHVDRHRRHAPARGRRRRDGRAHDDRATATVASSCSARSRRGPASRFAGTDMARGETRPAAGDPPARAARRACWRRSGGARSRVVRRPRVAILSTGDEIIAPGEPMRPAAVYDANATLLADAVRELGGEPRAAGHRRRRPGGARGGARRGASPCRPRAAQRRHEQGGRRPVLPRAGAATCRASSCTASR